MTAEYCGLPVGDHPCHLPGDHTGGCRAAPRCRCSHAQLLHTRGEDNCWIKVCGCASFREDPR